MKDDLKITGAKDYVDIECGNRTARFWGDLCANGFSAIASTMEWLAPEGAAEVKAEDRALLISKVRRFLRWKRFKIFFVDDNGKKIK